MSFLVSKPERIRRWVSEKFIVEGLRDLELFGEQPPGDTRRKTNDASSESIASFSKQEVMSSFLPEGGCYELVTVIGKGFEDLMTVNLARYKPTGEYVTVRRINLEACSNEMVTFLQGELHVSKLFNHPNIVPYRATFIADNELWVVTSFMAYGSAKDLICTHFMDGMNELAIAYILQGVLKALDYIHHMGYVHRISRVMMPSLTSTVWESQPVNWPTAMSPLRICLPPRSSDVPQRLCLNCFVLSRPSPILRAASLRTTVESLAW
uniref:STE20-related kinase adapter protein alpha n=1 Tax=Gorilla gorilla gorilla TaxID=9595 RepID=A0A2I2YMQ2_GORGO